MPPQEGILNLRTADLHPTPSVMLYEKFDERREIPVWKRSSKRSAPT